MHVHVWGQQNGGQGSSGCMRAVQHSTTHPLVGGVGHDLDAAGGRAGVKVSGHIEGRGPA